MTSFDYDPRTRIVFGAGRIGELGALTRELGAHRVLVVSDAGLKVSCFASQIGNWAKPVTGDFQRDIDELGRAVPRMKKFGTKFIRIMSWPNDARKPLSQKQWHDEVLVRLRELAKIAYNENIVLIHENCSGYGGQGPKQTLELVEEINSPAFRLLFDTGNFGAYGYDSFDFYLQVRKYIVYVHIKDAKKTEEEVYTFPGEGDGDVKKILKHLFDSGYDGVISIEPHIGVAIHSGRENSSLDKYHLYTEYGMKLMKLAESLSKTK